MSFLRHLEIFPSDEDETLSGSALAHRLDEFPAGYSSTGCSPVWGHMAHGQNVEGTQRHNGGAGVRGCRPSLQWCSSRARSSSVALGCVIETVVT
jgi:hypothetical protein